MMAPEISGMVTNRLRSFSIICAPGARETVLRPEEVTRRTENSHGHQELIVNRIGHCFIPPSSFELTEGSQGAGSND